MDKLIRQLRGGDWLERKRPAGPGRDKRLTDGRGAHLGAGPETGDAAKHLRWRGNAAHQEQAGSKDRREPASGVLTAISNASIASGRSRKAETQAAIGSSGSVRQCRVAQRGGKHVARM
jgi:hypothetical protein